MTFQIKMKILALTLVLIFFVATVALLKVYDPPRALSQIFWEEEEDFLSFGRPLEKPLFFGRPLENASGMVSLLEINKLKAMLHFQHQTASFLENYNFL